MAQKVQTLFIDDLDGSEADGTVRFGLDGTEYEIDLNAKHTQQLRDALARYIAAARRAGASAKQPARSRSKTTASVPNTNEIREWAKTQGGLCKTLLLLASGSLSEMCRKLAARRIR
jgi:hypothetical protein